LPGRCLIAGTALGGGPPALRELDRERLRARRLSVREAARQANRVGRAAARRSGPPRIPRRLRVPGRHFGSDGSHRGLHHVSGSAPKNTPEGPSSGRVAAIATWAAPSAALRIPWKAFISVAQ